MFSSIRCSIYLGGGGGGGGVGKPRQAQTSPDKGIAQNVELRGEEAEYFDQRHNLESSKWCTNQLKCFNHHGQFRAIKVFFAQMNFKPSHVHTIRAIKVQMMRSTN